MAFNLDQFGRGTMLLTTDAPTQHMYNSGADNAATVEGAGYFNDAAPLMKENDLIYCVMDAGAAIGFYQVTDISDAGVVTVIAFDTDVGAGAVGTANLADLAVTTAKLDDDAVTTDKLLDANVTSAKLEDLLVHHARVTMTAAQWNAMHVTPFELVAAPGAAEKLIPMRAVVNIDYGGSVFADGGAIHVQYDDTTLGAGPKATGTLAAATFIGFTADTTFGFTPVDTTLVDSTTLGVSLCLSNATGAFTGGAGSAFIVDIWYAIADYA